MYNILENIYLKLIKTILDKNYTLTWHKILILNKYYFSEINILISTYMFVFLNSVSHVFI